MGRPWVKRGRCLVGVAPRRDGCRAGGGCAGLCLLLLLSACDLGATPPPPTPVSLLPGSPIASPPAPAAPAAPAPPLPTTRAAGSFVFYPMWRPESLPAGLQPTDDPARDAQWPWMLVQHFDMPPLTDALVVRLGPALAASPLREARGGPAGVRSLVVERPGTLIRLEGRGEVTDALLATIAAGLREDPVRVGVRLDAAGAPDPAPQRLWASPLAFVDPLDGWTTRPLRPQPTPGPAALVATTDGGNTWQPRGPLPEGVEQWQFATPRLGWAFGSRFYRTDDSGQTWTADPARHDVVALAVWGDSVWAVEYPGAGERRLYLSDDRGHTWRPAGTVPIGGPGWHVARAGVAAAWVLSWGNYGHRSAVIGRLYATDDGARTWQERPDPCVGSGGVEDWLAAAPPAHVWLLCGSMPFSGAAQDKALFHSSDGGRQWSRVAAAGAGEHALPQGQIYGFALAGALQPWVAAVWPGLLFGTAEGGRTWPAAIPPDLASPGERPVEPVSFVDAQHGWFLTAGNIFRTSDGGRPWDMLPWP